jgi:hypothetical protein
VLAVLDGLRDLWRRLSTFELAPTPGPEGARRDGPVERPWRYYWDHLPKRTAGADFSSRDYAEARQRAEEVARTTLGDELWQRLTLDGHLDVCSRRYPGVTYRLRVGRRIEVLNEPGVRPPWPYPYLCINPTYPLPELEFFAHLFLYARDREDLLVRVAAPQPWDQRLGRTF